MREGVEMGGSLEVDSFRGGGLFLRGGGFFSRWLLSTFTISESGIPRWARGGGACALPLHTTYPPPFHTIPL